LCPSIRFHLGWDCVFALTGNDLKIALTGSRMDDFSARKMEAKSSTICKIFSSVAMACRLNSPRKKDDHFGMMTPSFAQKIPLRRITFGI
ncbi:hypothetical protein, partial [Klebsiella pneumoniae]|uniref:hypothetical protein n=1 Tax=Klebsiella pneumoniae TaxID=573 RepID=UPI001D0DFA99